MERVGPASRVELPEVWQRNGETLLQGGCVPALSALIRCTVATPTPTLAGALSLGGSLVNPTFSQTWATSPDRLSNRKNHNCQTTRGPCSRKPHS